MLQLLDKINFIADKYESISKITGENFNFFKLFGIETKEVSTHSKFIVELLDPKGTHGMNEKFLKIFLDKFSNLCFNTENTIVKAEKHIAKISKDFTEGGNIDIFISDEKSAIIIENKIYAEDQKNQLLRYYNFAKENYPNYNLFYLTLNGNEASKLSTGNKSFKYHSLSYENDIIQWLDLCKEKTVNYPILRETISQYIFLLKELTNQTNNEMKSKEIVDTIMSNDKNIKSFFDLQRSDIKSEVKSRLLLKFKKQMHELADKLNFDTKFDKKFGLIKDSTYLKFYFKNSPKNFYISLCFCSWDNKFVYQVDCNDEYRKECKKDVIELLSKRDGGFNEIWIKWFQGTLRNWGNNSEPWLKIIDNSLKSNIEEKLKDIIDRLSEYEK